MEVYVISKEHIKPSSPTPNNLKTYNFCLLDQLMLVPYAPIILFYLRHVDPVLLKRSLSETLTRFYPLAGKIRDDLSIDCDDGGALFVETRTNCSLSEFLSEPDVLVLHKLLPCEFGLEKSYVGTEVTNIQFNSFECGGAAVGICISHRILDGAGLSAFFRGWSAVARGDDRVVIPDFSAPFVFPADRSWPRESLMGLWRQILRKGKAVTKRFLFDSSGIALLKELAGRSDVENPSRVEVVSAFIWERLMAASGKLNDGERRPSVLTHNVNLRKRMTPPMSDDLLGNIFWKASAHCGKDDPDRSVGSLAARVRKSIRKIDSRLIEHLTGENMKIVTIKSLEEMIGTASEGEGVDHIRFTSWCNFGYYETDFGSGRPVWVSSTGLDLEAFLNLVILVDTRDGKGIEAWIMLDKTEMMVFEQDEEMARFARLNPSPLNFGDGTSG